MLHLPWTDGSSAVGQHGLNGAAGVSIGGRLLDMLEGIVADEPIDREAAQLVEAHEGRNEVLRLAIALGDADDASAVEQEVDVVNLDQTALINQSVASERGLAKEVGVERRAVLLNRVAAVGADATKQVEREEAEAACSTGPPSSKYRLLVTTDEERSGRGQ